MKNKLKNYYLPWWQATYIPYNGFHPLYSYILTVNCAELKTISPNSIINNDVVISNKNINYFGPEGISKEIYSNFIAINEIYLLIDDAIYFHHTCAPLFLRNKFIFHCESFLPIFMPFAFQGKGFVNSNQIDIIRNKYKLIFESNYCIAIATHIKSTFETLLEFFNSDIIKSKLKYIEIGFLPTEYKIKDINNNKSSISHDRFEKLSRLAINKKSFIFNNSSSQNLSQFALRGGVIALKFIEQIIEKYEDIIFIFRCEKPNNEIFEKYNINFDLINKYENQKIFWLENYLSDYEMDRILNFCDFNLLVSANLHSHTILRSMYHNCIPIVSDTIGVEEFCIDKVNSYVISGVKDTVWVYDENNKFSYDRHDVFLDPLFQNKMADNTVKLFNDVILVQHPFIKLNSNSIVLSKYNALIKSNELFNFYNMHNKTESKINDVKQFNIEILNFRNQTTPKIINNLGDYKILLFQNIYYVETPLRRYTDTNSISLLGNDEISPVLNHFEFYQDAISYLNSIFTNDRDTSDIKENKLKTYKIFIKYNYPFVFNILKLVFNFGKKLIIKF